MGDKIKLIRLLTGEELIAKCDINDNVVIVNKPLLVILTQDNQTTLFPWQLFSKDDTFELQRDHILCISTPMSSLTQGYQEQTSQIITAPAGTLDALKGD